MRAAGEVVRHVISDSACNIRVDRRMRFGKKEEGEERRRGGEEKKREKESMNISS